MSAESQKLIEDNDEATDDCHFNKAGCCSKIFFQWAYFFMKVSDRCDE
jgi:hypothetical protein